MKVSKTSGHRTLNRGRARIVFVKLQHGWLLLLRDDSKPPWPSRSTAVATNPPLVGWSAKVVTVDVSSVNHRNLLLRTRVVDGAAPTQNGHLATARVTRWKLADCSKSAARSGSNTSQSPGETPVSNDDFALASTVANTSTSLERMEKPPSFRPSRTPRGAPTEWKNRLRFDRRERFDIRRQNGKIAFASTVANPSRCPDRTNKTRSTCPKNDTALTRSLPQNRPTSTRSLPQNGQTLTRTLPQNRARLLDSLP